MNTANTTMDGQSLKCGHAETTIGTAGKVAEVAAPRPLTRRRCPVGIAVAEAIRFAAVRFVVFEPPGTRMDTEMSVTNVVARMITNPTVASEVATSELQNFYFFVWLSYGSKSFGFRIVVAAAAAASFVVVVVAVAVAVVISFAHDALNVASRAKDEVLKSK